MKASSGLKFLNLWFNDKLLVADLDSCLDYIFQLDQIKILDLRWRRLSAGNIISSLNKQGKEKRISSLCLSEAHRPFSGFDILEISSFLPELQEWTGDSQSFGITVEMAREWKRICPKLEIVELLGLSDEVEVVLQDMGVDVYEKG